MLNAPQLEDQVLAALERALQERRLDVAEHLLCAMEVLCADLSLGSPLTDAYYCVARQLVPGRQPT